MDKTTNTWKDESWRQEGNDYALPPLNKKVIINKMDIFPSGQDYTYLSISMTRVLGQRCICIFLREIGKQEKGKILSVQEV